eukprot:Hpha_TRINITY_DN15984_c1_g1::TRINITY_DN15984_c1_g1_i1::g.72837::m.72837
MVTRSRSQEAALLCVADAKKRAQRRSYSISNSRSISPTRSVQNSDWDASSAASTALTAFSANSALWVPRAVRPFAGHAYRPSGSPARAPPLAGDAEFGGRVSTRTAEAHSKRFSGARRGTTPMGAPPPMSGRSTPVAEEAGGAPPDELRDAAALRSLPPSAVSEALVPPRRFATDSLDASRARANTVAPRAPQYARRSRSGTVGHTPATDAPVSGTDAAALCSLPLSAVSEALVPPVTPQTDPLAPGPSRSRTSTITTLPAGRDALRSRSGTVGHTHDR